jgi:nucleoside diphosphate kinase
MNSELAHVMLKPDSLSSNLRDIVLRELLDAGGSVVASKRLTLSLSQIAAIYPRFPNRRAQPFIFAYFTSRETEHFAFVGNEGLHARLNEAKGQTGTGQGIRGKYYTTYTRLSQAALDEWLWGTSPQAAEIDLEMFGRDILHVADNSEDSLRALRAILDPADLRPIDVIGLKV